MAYNKLIDHLVNLESAITTSKPEKQGTKSAKFDKKTKKGDSKKQKSKDKERSDSSFRGKYCILCKVLK